MQANSRDATGNPEDPVPRGPDHIFTPQFVKKWYQNEVISEINKF